MTLLILIGYIMAFIGSFFGLIGAYLTSSKDEYQRHLGFLCWITNSPALVLFMAGVTFGWFEPVSAFILIPLNAVYLFTAVRGYLTTKREMTNG